MTNTIKTTTTPTSSSEQEKRPDMSAQRLKEILDPIMTYKNKSKNGKPTCEFSNWSGEFHAHPMAIFRPYNEQQIKLVLELCKLESKKIRCFGAGHSPSDLACSNDYMINLDRLSGFIDVDQSSKCIEVWAGTRLKDFHEIAGRYKLGMTVLGSISEQSVGGAISTATHGCGYEYGCISRYVKSLTIILADSTQVTVDESNGRELFLASLCGLGLTGLITRVRFQCEDAFNLHEISYSIPLDLFLSNYHSIAQSAQHVRMSWFPQVDRVNVHLLNRTSKPCDPDTWRKALRDKLMGFFQWYIHPSILLLTKYLPIMTTYYMIASYHLFNKPNIHINETKKLQEMEMNVEKAMGVEATNRHTLIGSRVNTSVKIFNIDCGPPHHTYEGAIPFELTSKALKEFRAFLKSEITKSNGIKMHFPMEIRPVDADQIWLSPASGRKVTYLGLVQFKSFGIEINPGYKKLFEKFEEILTKNYELRSHWAKRHTHSFQSLEKSFKSSNNDNNFNKFLDLRAQVDPDFRFLNEYVSRHFIKN